MVNAETKEWRELMWKAAGSNMLDDPDQLARVREVFEARPPGAGVDDRLGVERETALMLASWLGRSLICQYLLAAGADPLLRARDGRSAQNYALYQQGGGPLRRERCRKLIEAVAGEQPRPRRYHLKITFLRLAGEVGIKSVREKVERRLKSALGLGVSWNSSSRSGVGHVWLLDSEVDAAGLAVAKGVSSSIVASFELERDEVGP